MRLARYPQMLNGLTAFCRKRNSTAVATAIVAFLILMAVPASADGGGPILLLVSLYLFVVGQVWIVLSEFIYLKLLHRQESARSVLKVVVLMNLISMVLGGLALPFLLAAVGFLGILMQGNPTFNSFGEYLFAAGTWVVGDNSPHRILVLISTGMGFVGTYFITVYVERWYLNRRTQKYAFPRTSLVHCYYINAISYLGLMALMSVSTFFGK